MAERIIRHGHLTLWTESFGDIHNPAILLIMGIGGQAIVWPEKLCNLLAENGFFVIRYDNRDTGKSSRIDYSKNPYDLEDMADDAIAILDNYGIEKTAIMGLSMGGSIAQLIALKYPNRVSHLVLIMSTPDLSIIVKTVFPFVFRIVARLFLPLGSRRSDLPAPQSDVVNFFRSQIFLPFKSKQKQLEAAVNAWRIFSGGGIFDEAEFRRLEERALNRADNEDGYINHAKAILRSLKKQVDLKNVLQPTLIIHGKLDPVFPPEHGQKIAREIPEARLEIIADIGHIIPNALSEKLAFLVTTFLKKGK